MPTERVEIGPKHIKDAVSAAEARTYTSANPLIYADVVEKGLQLRIQASSVNWILRWNGKTKSLGNLADITNAKSAREIAIKTRNLMKDGTDPKAFLTGKAVGKSSDKAFAAAVRQSALANDQWTWERLVTEYTDGYLSKPRLVKGRIRQPSLASAQQAKRSLTPPEAEKLNGILLSELSARHIEGVRGECAERAKTKGAKTASRTFVVNTKAALSFAKRKHKAQSGLERIEAWWLGIEILDSTAIESRTRTPRIEDLARMVYVAEKHRILEGRKNSRATSETMLCGLWWIMLTAQRTGAALALEKIHVLPWPKGPQGWKVVSWSEEAMKSKRFHALPIPPRLALLIERAKVTGRENSRYVFPSTAVRTGVDDGHLDKNGPKNLIARLRGNPLTLKREEKEIRNDLPDLLEDIPHFSPHDVRRTFATICGDMAIRGDAISAVLDHAGLDTGQQMMKSAEVTRLAYDYSQKLELKRIAIEAWTNRLFEECDKIWKEKYHRPRSLAEHAELQKFSYINLDLAKGIPFSEKEPWYQIIEKRAELMKSAKPFKLKRTSYDIDNDILSHGDE